MPSTQSEAVTQPPTPEAVQARFAAVRQASESLTATLSAEDQVVQSMPDASPTKWHLAHTTWFFETFILTPNHPGYRVFQRDFGYLFNSYYEAAGPRHPRPRRGLLTRPCLAEVRRYRRYVDEQLTLLIAQADGATWQMIAPLIELGLHHEQQHQELILTDILHAFAQNPLAPAAFPLVESPQVAPTDLGWESFEGGLRRIGHDGGDFAYDNERPAHLVHLQPFCLATRPVDCGEFLAFMDDGGYRDPKLWLADGWAAVQAEGWQAPLYWRWHDGEWWQMTLSGMLPLDRQAPVCHVSYYEADAFARWAGKRLPLEAEWEVAARTVTPGGNFADAGIYRPLATPSATGLSQVYGDVWEWTASAYLAYPGFRPAAGAVGEYNGKFMCNQMVLRGGSCATPASHIRATYRNYFYPAQRWQFSGIRLAEDA